MYMGKLKQRGGCVCDTPMLTRPGPGGWVSTPLRGLAGLGYMEYIAAAASLFGDRGGKAGQAAPQQTNVTTTTHVNTQVNPQISPVFVQQSDPRDSAVSAALTSTQSQMPGMMPPITGQVPGIDYPRPVMAESNLPLIAAAALLGLAVVMKSGRKGRKR